MVEVGDTLNGRYRITAHIGRGGSSDVWAARDTLLKRDVAVKTVEHVSASLDARTILVNEAEVSARLEHPNVMPVYDFGTYQGQNFLVMRYLPHGSLEDYLASHQLTSDEVLRMAQQIAGALDYLHDSQVLYLGLKPRNVLLDARNYPYLSGFAVSAWLGPDGRTSNPGSGTLLYMAPEQLTADILDFRTDLYSLGIMLFVCFTGRLPFDATEPLALRQLQYQDNLPSVRQTHPELPLGIDVVLNRLTRLNPDERYASASEAVEELYRAYYSGQRDVEGRIFVSYAHKDKEYVHALVEELRNFGIDLWIDQDIPPGANWDHSVQSALDAADKMLLILSPAAIESENVHDEWSYFIGQRKAIYPFIFQPCEIPFRLRRRQHVTSTGDKLNDVRKIVDVLAQGTAGSAEE